MLIQRRQFLMLAAATGLLPTRLWSATELQLTGGTLLSLSDGHLVVADSYVIGGLSEDEMRAILEQAPAARESIAEPPCNLALWRHGDATVLFDAGSGPAFMETTGKLPEALAAAGLDPEDITHVVFTHGHPDHFWGVLDDFDEPLFPNARHLMGAEEHAYWSDPDTINTIDGDRESFAAGALRRLEVLGDRVDLFADGDEVAPGVRAMATFGHTPGHMAFDVDGVLITGDAIVNGHAALVRPHLPVPADQQPEIAIQTRLALLEQLAESGATMVGFHLPGDGVGTISRNDGDGYIFTPAAATGQ